jgi:hypothetical protein
MGLLALSSLALSAVVLSSAATAQTPLAASDIPKLTRATTQAESFRRLKLPGSEVRRAVKKTTRLEWKKTLKSAQVAAVKTGKPIVWIHALGTLNGYT